MHPLLRPRSQPRSNGCCPTRAFATLLARSVGRAATRAAPVPPPRNSKVCSPDRIYCQVVTPAPIAVPDAVRRRAFAYGEVGARWLEELPAIVEELERRWRVKVGSPFTG